MTDRPASYTAHDFPAVVQVTSARFHQFDLARQLEERGLLQAIYTGYPRWKLRNEGLPQDKTRTFPWIQAPLMAGASRWLRALRAEGLVQHWNRVMIDRHAAATLSPMPDVLIAMSGHGTACGRLVQEAGGRWICVRGSTHIRHQQEVLRAEYGRWGFPYTPPLERAMAREEFEYAHADRIAVPSRQVLRSFTARGIPEGRLALAPYGVDPGRFQKAAEPDPAAFQILFVGALSIRKGIGHLLAAFRQLKHPRKRLVLVGSAMPETRMLLKNAPDGVEVRGHCPQSELKHLMSRSHVFALCSVEEGLANVMGQALACGCPVVATEATGAADLFEDGKQGFIVRESDPALIAERLERLVGDPQLRQTMSEAAIRRVAEIGGWDRYGDVMEALIRQDEW